jgi:hypothetical protein
VGTSSLPLAIIGGLLYAAFFVKAEPEIGTLKARPLERRDAFYGVAAPEGSILWAAGSYGKIVRSEDGGLTWGVQGSPVITHLQSIAAWDARRAVAVGNRGLVEITDDAGKTWKEVTVPRSEVANKLLQVRAYPDGAAWAVGELGAVLKTADFGTTWTRVLPRRIRPGTTSSSSARTAGWWASSARSSARRMAASWIAVPSPVKNSLMSVHFRDAQHGVAVGLAGTVLVSADGGASWQEAPP